MPVSELIAVKCSDCEGYLYGCVPIDEYFDIKERMKVEGYAALGLEVEIIERSAFSICTCSSDNSITTKGDGDN